MEGGGKRSERAVGCGERRALLLFLSTWKLSGFISLPSALRAIFLTFRIISLKCMTVLIQKVAVGFDEGERRPAQRTPVINRNRG